MLYDKKTRSLFYEGKEQVLDLLTEEQCNKLTRFLVVHFGKLTSYGGISQELKEQFFMHFGKGEPREAFYGLYRKSLKDLYLIIEIFSKTLLKVYSKYQMDFFLDYQQDINNFFMIEKTPFQLIYLESTSDLFMEKIIDDVHSDEVKKILTIFSKYDKVHEDFKKSIIAHSSGDNKTAVESCCVAIEDYLCIILEKDSCSSIDSFYKEASKRLKIPVDINERFKLMISFIHGYRSKPLHGSSKVHDPKNPHLVAQIIIGFTMIILHYLYVIFEK